MSKMGQGTKDEILGGIQVTVLRWILMIFLGYVRNGKRKKWLDFGRDPDHHLNLVDPGIL